MDQRGANNPNWKGGITKQTWMTRVCLCGCGEYTRKYDKSGKERFYKQGHHARVNPPQKGEKHFNWKGGRKMHDGYVLIRTQNHPRLDKKGYVPEHVLVMEKYLGRYLTDKEIVHHLNSKRNDNRIQNLKLINQGQHINIHINEGRKIPNDRRCIKCGGDNIDRDWFRIDNNKFQCKACYDRQTYLRRKRIKCS